MFFVIGWNRKTEKDFGPILLRNCNICNDMKYWHLLRERTWFTLLWIPFIPYETEWIILCSGCCIGSITLRPEDIDKAKILCKQTRPFLDRIITSEEYQSQLKYLETTLANSLSPRNAVRLNPEDAIRHCPTCGAEYRLSDYRADVKHIICWGCMSELPKEENFVGTDASQPLYEQKRI